MMPEHMHTFPDNKIEFYVQQARENIVKLETTQALLDKEPPSYPYDEAVKRWHLGTKKSVSLESAPYLVNRGTKQSKNQPKQFYFSRDSRLKVLLFAPENNDFSRAVVQRIKSPMLYIKATDSKYATDDFNIEIRQVLTKIHDKYEMHSVPGTHHVHLNTPDIVAPIITQFLEKYHIQHMENEKIQNKCP
ncbi:Probable serine hydrolase [Eumeta japonica]|uniref:Probable serine hydrolase n=1 Tax=Eumeta variegata TaxID=151549 RepID=A0A4C1T9N6_EUMVA|nr:Probable serine hydrolase [Eumeta japonica]